MNLSVPSYVAGPFFLLILFALCVITVVGAKALYKSVKDKFAKPEEKPRKRQQEKQPKKRPEERLKKKQEEQPKKRPEERPRKRQQEKLRKRQPTRKNLKEIHREYRMTLSV